MQQQAPYTASAARAELQTASVTSSRSTARTARRAPSMTSTAAQPSHAVAPGCASPSREARAALLATISGQAATWQAG
eukprot:2061021-Alexandrium_andersonii.AAC.1